MSGQDEQAEHAADLRARAEEVAAQSPDSIEALSSEETQQVLHDLRVHQIELEMQNEELRRAQEELAESRDRYADLYDHAPVGYCLLSEKGLILEADLTAANLLDAARGALIKQPITRFILKEDQDIYYHHRKALFDTGEPQVCDLRMVKKDGTAFWTCLEATAGQDVDGAPVCRVVMTDTTERKQAEAALRESESFAKATLNGLSSHIAILDQDGRIEAVNEAWRQFANDNGGLPGSVCEGADYLGVCDGATGQDSEDARQFAEAIRGILAGRRSEFNHEYACHSPDEQRWFTGRVTRFPGEGPPRAVVAHEDVTARKCAEQALHESERRVRTKLDAILAPEDDIEILELADVIDVPRIQAMMDTFFTLTGIGVAILDLNGKILVATGWQDICTKFHRVHPETSKRCLESDTVLARGVEPNTFRRYRCKNNMWDIATPIALGNRHVGSLFLGQFLFEDEQPEVEVFRAQARQYGFDEAEYLAALARVPRWSREKVDQVMTFYTEFAKLVSELSYSNLTLARTLTESRRAEEALRESELLHRTTIGNISDTVLITDDKGVFTYVCPNTHLVFGWHAEEVMNFSNISVLLGSHLYDPEELKREGELKNIELAIADRSGDEHWLLVNVKRVRIGRGTVLWTCRDITERKRAEQQLRFLGNIAEQVTDSIMVTDTAFRIVYLNEAAQKLFGYAEDELLGQCPDVVNAKPESSRIQEELYETVSSGQSYLGTGLNRRKDGSTFICEFKVSPMWDEQGGISGYVGIQRDVTERKRAQDEIEGLSRFPSEDPNPVLRISKNGAVLYANASAEELLQEEGAAVGKSAPQGWREQASRVLGTGSVDHFEWPHGGKTFLFALAPVKDGNYVNFYGQEITKLRRAERVAQESREQLFQAEKMAALGTLISGVAHEINNPNNFIMLNTPVLEQVFRAVLPLLEKKSQEEGDFRVGKMAYSKVKEGVPRLLSGIREGSQRIKQYVSELRDFGRQEGSGYRELLDLRKATDSAVMLTENLIAKSTNRFEFNRPESLPSIRAHPQRIEQVVINLIQNACQALTSLEQALTLDITHDAAENAVLLTVRDEGAGMSEETSAHLFDPFYTTKRETGGTGLGLSVSKRIADEHAGRLEFESELGKGTTARLVLPIARGGGGR